jgi:hypothetical protein
MFEIVPVHLRWGHTVFGFEFVVAQLPSRKDATACSDFLCLEFDNQCRHVILATHAEASIAELKVIDKLAP